MKIGYCRVSTTAQNIDRQTDALTAAGCEKIFIDKCTGTKSNRPQLIEMFEYVRSGDKIVVTELSRFGRSTRDLLNLVDLIKEAGAEFICLKDNIDTSTPQGSFFFTVSAAISQLQRDITVQNVKEGLDAARARGRCGGRPKVKKGAIQTALKLYQTKDYSLAQISKMTGVSISTIYNYRNKAD